MQLYRLIYYSQSALHVSGRVFAHHQEHLTVFTISGSIHPSCCRLAVPVPTCTETERARTHLVLFYSILFYSILFYSILFYSIPFYSILFYSIRFYSILFYSIPFHSILFHSILFYSILFQVQSGIMMAETALFLGTKLMSQTVKFKTKTIAEASNLLQSRRT